MKILVIANDSGGVFRFRKMLLESLINKNNNVTVITPFGTEIDKLSEMDLKLIDVPVDRRGLNPLKDFSLIMKYNSIINTLKPDCVITYTIKPNIYAGLICRFKHINYVINITGLGSTFQNNGVLRKLIQFLYRISVKSAKVVFFENEANRELFIEERIAKKNQTYKLNGAGVDIKYFKPTEYKDYVKTKFLFIGRIMKEKGVDELFDAIHMLLESGIEVELDMLGSYEENYRVMIDKYEKEGWLKYHGVVSDVRPYINECSCFVLPSWHEGMANTILECAASARPIITSRIPGCMEAVIDEKSGYLCEPKDAVDLYEKLKLFASLTYESKRLMGLVGRHYMEEVFDKKKVVEDTISRIRDAGVLI